MLYLWATAASADLFISGRNDNRPGWIGVLGILGILATLLLLDKLVLLLLGRLLLIGRLVLLLIDWLLLLLLDRFLLLDRVVGWRVEAGCVEGCKGNLDRYATHRTRVDLQLSVTTRRTSRTEDKSSP